MAKRPFSVRLLWSDLAAAAANQVASYDMNNGDVFVAESATREVLGAALTGLQESARVLPLVTVSLQDNSSGQLLSNEQVPITTISGDAKNPYFFNRPLVFRSKPYALASNISTDTTYKRVYLVLHGYIQNAAEFDEEQKRIR